MKQSGFSLIEMLTVIAIISILAALGFSMLSKERAKARDSIRISDFKQFETALDIYYIKYHMYPCGNSGVASTEDWHDCKSGVLGVSFLNGASSDKGAGCTALGPYYGLVTEGLLSTSPLDPLGKFPHEYGYQVSFDRQKYVLAVILEEDEDELMKNDGGQCENYYEAGNWGDQVEDDTSSTFGGEWWKIKFCTGDGYNPPTEYQNCIES